MILTRLIHTKGGIDAGISEFPKVIYIPKKFSFVAVDFRGQSMVVLDEHLRIISGTATENFADRFTETDECLMCGTKFTKRWYGHKLCSQNCRNKHRITKMKGTRRYYGKI